MRWLVLLSCLFALAAGTTSATAAEQMTPVNCASAALRVPFSGQLVCENGEPFQGTSMRHTCTYMSTAVRGQDARNRFLAIGVQGDGSSCQVHDAASTLPTATAFVRSNGRDFSSPRQLGGSITAVTFTGTDEGRSLPCFAFQKLGSVQGGGYANRVLGYVCNRDGAAVNDGAIQQLVGAMTLR